MSVYCIIYTVLLSKSVHHAEFTRTSLADETEPGLAGDLQRFPAEPAADSQAGPGPD